MNEYEVSVSELRACNSNKRKHPTADEQYDTLIKWVMAVGDLLFSQEPIVKKVPSYDEPVTAEKWPYIPSLPMDWLCPHCGHDDPYPAGREAGPCCDKGGWDYE